MNSIVLTNVTKTYGTGTQTVTALDNVNLSISEGELVAIIGPSGSGKSTLLAIAGGLLTPTHGSVVVSGTDVAKLSLKARSTFRLSKIGFVLQSANLLPYLTVKEQLLLVPTLANTKTAASETHAQTLLSELGLSHRLNHYPDQLSGGERQRVAIGRALMNDPAIVLADEPTANLDSQRGRSVVELLANAIRSRNKAGILVTHDERVLDLCDRVIRIADGSIQAMPLVSTAV